MVSFYSVKGTHKSNKPVNSQGAIISRFASGKEVEAWDIYDRFALALQLAPGLAKAMLRFVEKQMVKDRPWQFGCAQRRLGNRHDPGRVQPRRAQLASARSKR